MKSRFFFAAYWTVVAVGFSQEPTIAPSDRYPALQRGNAESSLAHFRFAESHFSEKNLQSAANEFREALNGDHDVSWTEVWSHINLGKIFDATGQCARARGEYLHAMETNDNTHGALDEASAYLKSNTIAPFSKQPEVSDLPAATVNAPYLYHKTPPEYSDEARLAGLEGMVILHGLIAEDGSTAEMKVSQSLGLGLDEKAIEAVKEWRYLPGSLAGNPIPSPVKVEVEFRLPSKESRWHLIRLEFQPGSETSRPIFLKADYPSGAGVRRDSIDDARLVAIMGRYATTTLSFDVNEHGTPVNFVVLGASREVWGQEAMGIVRKWRFRPGMKDGVPVSVPCQIDMVWGSRTLVSHPQLELGDVSKVTTDIVVDGCRTAR